MHANRQRTAAIGAHVEKAKTVFNIKTAKHYPKEHFSLHEDVPGAKMMEKYKE